MKSRVYSAPGGGNGSPLQDSCLGKSTDRGAWWAIVHGSQSHGAKSDMTEQITRAQHGNCSCPRQQKECGAKEQLAGEGTLSSAEAQRGTWRGN